MGTKHWSSALSTFGLALAVSAGSLAAQQTSLERAARLEAQAGSLFGQMEEWKDAAHLLREAADLRPEGDPLAVQNLLQAARLAYYMGDQRTAIGDMEAAAERALSEGDVVTAANAFADAAWIATDEGMGERALELAGRAQRLSFSPLIGEGERAYLRSRFSGGAVTGF